MGREEYERGHQFEEDFAARLGARTQPGSGNQWYARMDLGEGQPVLFSLKSTKHRSFTLGAKDVQEVVDAVDAPGGVGGNTIPAMGLRIASADDDLVVLRLSDFIRMHEEKIAYVQQSKADAKRERSRVPILMREE